MTNFQIALFGALGALISAIIGALIQRYGFPFVESYRNIDKIKCSGVAKDMDASDLSNDFSFSKYEEYSITECIFVINKKTDKIEVNAKLILDIGDNNSPQLFTAFAQGSLVDGVAYLSYAPKNKAKGTSWSGVMVLHIPRLGMISGYWLTENLRIKGKLAFGKIELDRIS